MIKITLTETYGGFNITGDYQDFLHLDAAFNYFLIEEATQKEEIMQKRILEFMKAMHNCNQDSNIFFFKYPLPELITDIIIFKYLVKKKENIDEFNENYHEVFLFFSKVIASLKNIVSKRKFDIIYKLMLKGYIDAEAYIKQWFDKLIIDYLNMTKSAREKRLAKVVEGICDWLNFSPEGYEFMQDKVKEEAIKNNCSEEDVVFEEFPTRIDW